MAGLCFYCRLLKSDNVENLATGIQVCIPAGMTKAGAKEYALARISEELDRYALDEALALGHYDARTTSA